MSPRGRMLLCVFILLDIRNTISGSRDANQYLKVPRGSIKSENIYLSRCLWKSAGMSAPILRSVRHLPQSLAPSSYNLSTVTCNVATTFGFSINQTHLVANVQTVPS